jgi:hypothetical protein
VDRDFWRINWIRGSVTAQLPWKWKGDKIAKELGVIYEKLEEAIGGEVKRTWPVIHFLATRKWYHQLRHKTASDKIQPAKCRPVCPISEILIRCMYTKSFHTFTSAIAFYQASAIAPAGVPYRTFP